MAQPYGGISTDLAELFLLAEFGSVDHVPSAKHYFALGSDAAPLHDTFTELSAGNYARKEMTNNTTTWDPVAVTSDNVVTVSNDAVITFATATGTSPADDWGSAKSWAIFDAAVDGTKLAWGELTVDKTITVGDTPSFAAGTITISIQSTDA